MVGNLRYNESLPGQTCNRWWRGSKLIRRPWQRCEGLRSTGKDARSEAHCGTGKLLRKHEATGNMIPSTFKVSGQLPHNSWTQTTYLWLWSPAWEWRYRRGWRWHCTQWILQRPLGCTRQTRCCHKGTEPIYKERQHDTLYKCHELASSDVEAIATLIWV